MSDILRTAARNTVAVLVARGVSMLSGVAFVALFSRYVGLESFGEYSYAMSIATLLAGFVAFGFDALAIREIAQTPARVGIIVGQALFVQVVLAVCFLLGLGIYWTRIHPDRGMLVISMIVAAYMFLDTISLLLISIFRAQECMQYETLAVTAGNVMMVLLTAVGIWMRVSTGWILLMVGASYLLKFGIILYLARLKCGLTSVVWQSRPRFSHVRPAVPFLLVMIGANIHSTYPRLVLGYAASMQDVGLYAAAEKVITLVTVLAGVLDIVVYPIFAKKIQASRQEFAQTYKQIADLILVLGLIVGLALAAITPEVVSALFGPAFKGAVPITILLVPTISMAVSAYVNTRAIFTLREERLMAVVLMITAISGFLIASAVVGVWGYTGIALSYAITIGFGFLFYFVYIRKQLGLPWRTPAYLQYFAVFPMAFLLSYMSRDLALIQRVLVHAGLIAVLTLVFRWSGLLDSRKLFELGRAFIPRRTISSYGVVQKSVLGNDA